MESGGRAFDRRRRVKRSCTIFLHGLRSLRLSEGRARNLILMDAMQRSMELRVCVCGCGGVNCV